MSSQLRSLDEELTRREHEFGITRIADTSGLDRLELFTHSVVRPNTTDGIWVYSGKGASRHASRVSAIMECIERTSALWKSRHVRLATAVELGGTAWAPERFTVKLNPDYHKEQELAWVLATCVAGPQKNIWVPAHLVFNGFAPPELFSPFACNTTNGLAAGTTREQALSNALLELIERDAVACAEVHGSHAAFSRLLALGAAFGVKTRDFATKFVDDTNVAVTIDLATLPSGPLEIAERFAAAGLRLTLKFVPNQFGIPIFGAACSEDMSFDNVLATAGFAAGFDLTNTACRAMLEVAQSRATDRQGAREDCGLGEKARHEGTPGEHWLLSPGVAKVAFNRLPWGTQHGSASSSVARCVQALRHAGLEDAAYFEFDAYPGLSAVRAVVPEIETWHATGGDSRLGKRLRRAVGIAGPEAESE